ncbi:hypothetical protein ABIB48_002642 [Arthrobacter sp. UYCu511]|uniref:hypothetical protein n=1 Tax=Arthrobacter sp. UYCu511 TaxID=3156337 RepID=UPI003391A4CF
MSNICTVGALACTDFTSLIISGITTLAFLATVYQLFTERRRHKNAERAAQAKDVTAWFDDYSGNAKIRNSSGAVVYDIYAVMVDGRHESEGKPPAFPEAGQILRLVPPESTLEVPAPAGWAGAGFQPSYEICFRDAQGVTWLRNNRGILTESKKDVFDRYDLMRPVSYFSWPIQIM